VKVFVPSFRTWYLPSVDSFVVDRTPATSHPGAGAVDKARARRKAATGSHRRSLQATRGFEMVVVYPFEAV
jgi:hypothetical protein